MQQLYSRRQLPVIVFGTLAYNSVDYIYEHVLILADRDDSKIMNMQITLNGSLETK